MLMWATSALGGGYQAVLVRRAEDGRRFEDGGGGDRTGAATAAKAPPATPPPASGGGTSATGVATNMGAAATAATAELGDAQRRTERIGGKDAERSSGARRCRDGALHGGEPSVATEAALVAAPPLVHKACLGRCVEPARCRNGEGLPGETAPETAVRTAVLLAATAAAAASVVAVTSTAAPPRSPVTGGMTRMLARSPRAEDTPRAEAMAEASRAVAASRRADAGVDGASATVAMAAVSAVGNHKSPPAKTSEHGEVNVADPPALAAPAVPRALAALSWACSS